MFQRRRIELADGVMAGIEFGAADRPLDVIFLHANGFNGLTYRQALAPLCEEMRILALDLRGHGGSDLPVPEGAPGWQVHADDLLAAIAAIGQVPRILAGHSMGGTVALLAASRAGVGRLALFDPVLAPASMYACGGPDWQFPLAAGALRRKDFFADRDAAWAAYHGRGAFRTWPDEVLADYLQDGLRAAPEGFTLACAPRWEAANFAGFCVTDPYPALSEFAGDVHVLRAQNNSTCSLSDGVRIVPETSHFLPMERPDLVRLLLQKFEERKNLLF